MRLTSKTYLLLILLLLIVLSYIFYRYSSAFLLPPWYELFTNTNASSFYKCQERLVLPALEEIFQEYKIERKDLKSWDLYLPCGYTHVEDELSTLLLPTSPPQTAEGEKKTLYIFGIRGCDQMVGKSNLWSALQAEYGFEKASTIMPPSYSYADPKDVALLQHTFSPDKIYILKKNIQRKEGLKLTQDLGEVMHGKENGYVVAQTYIRDLYLINDYKVNLRIYLLIVLRGPDIQFYLSKSGKCIYTNKKYNDDDLDFTSNITSYHLDMTIYETNPRTLDDLEEYIEADRPGAYPAFQRSIDENLRKMCMALKNRFYQSGSKESPLQKDHTDIVNFQLFGVDVIMDSKLNPYILEVNKGPDMTGRDEIDTVLKKNVQLHMLEKVGVIHDDIIHEKNLFYAL
jgi:hypothetical protein